MSVPYVRTMAAAGASAPCVHNADQSPFNMSLTLAIAAGSVLTAKVQFSTDDVQGATDPTGAGLTWQDHATLTGASSGTVSGNVAFPITASRLVVTAYTSGSVTMTTIQGGP